MASIADKYIEEGMRKGLQQGIQEGARDALLEVLAARFGRVPASLVKRVRGVEDVSLLRGLLKEAATADSLGTLPASAGERHLEVTRGAFPPAARRG